MIKKFSVFFKGDLPKLINLNSRTIPGIALREALKLPGEIMTLLIHQDPVPSQTLHDEDSLKKYFHTGWHENKRLYKLLKEKHRMQVVYEKSGTDCINANVLFYDKGEKIPSAILNTMVDNKGKWYLLGYRTQ